MRKELVRLRMELHRQQVRYHCAPWRHPLQQVRHLFSPYGLPTASKTPFALGATLLLDLFGKRLGRFGQLARFALALYPLLGPRPDRTPTHGNRHRAPAEP